MCADPGEEFVTGSDLLGLSGRVPRFVIDATNEHRELVGQLGCLVDRQTIARAMEHGAQRLVSPVAV
jgi:hypothetical protein